MKYQIVAICYYSLFFVFTYHAIKKLWVFLMLNEIFTFPQELSFEIITLFMTPQVGRGHSAHLLESHVQCASKPSLPKLMCDATLMRCIVVCEGTPSHPASPHAPASPSHWKSRLPERAAMPRQHVATAPSPPL